MTKQEAEAFESLSNFSAILEMRTWDEKAKDVSIELINNDKFKNLIKKNAGPKCGLCEHR